MLDRRGCLLALGGCLLIAGGGYALAFLTCLALGRALRDVLHPDLLVALLVLASFPLWGLFAFAAATALTLVLGRREAERRRRFEGRAVLTDEAFGRLFPEAWAPTAVGVRAELGRFLGRAEVAGRLLPQDPVRATCELFGLSRDDLDWAEFLFGLEARFGGRLPPEADREATVAELVVGCAGGAGGQAQTASGVRST